MLKPEGGCGGINGKPHRPDDKPLRGAWQEGENHAMGSVIPREGAAVSGGQAKDCAR